MHLASRTRLRDLPLRALRRERPCLRPHRDLPDSVRLVAVRRAAEVRERRAARQRLGKAHWLWPHRKPKQKPKPKRDDMNDEIPFVLAAVAMIPLLARLAGSGTLL